MAEHDQDALDMFNSGMTYREIADHFQMTEKAINHAILRARKKFSYEDKQEYSEEDISDYIDRMVSLQEAAQKLDTKQIRTTIRINDDKPVGIAYWGDWHIGSAGTDYKLFQEDLEKIKNTDGLYFIGAGDYKDNYITGTHPGGQFGQIIQPGMQDMIVKHYLEQVASKCLALIRGCHDSWDQKQGNKDFVQYLCDEIDAINLWHGGEIFIKIGTQEYHWRCRHKYKYQSSLNLENAMRRINEIQGPCDVAAEAHLHNGYVMCRHLMREYRIMLRCGSYKIRDDYGQQLAGYVGLPAVPVVILHPDRKLMSAHLDLNSAIEVLNNLRGPGMVSTG